MVIKLKQLEKIKKHSNLSLFFNLGPGPVRVFRELLIATACFISVTLLYFWPILPKFASALVGPPEDNLQFYWFLWYGKRALLDPNLSFLHSKLIFYPEGANLLFANYFYYGVFLSLGLGVFMSLPAVFNFLVLHTFVLAGIGTFLLVRELTDDFKASLMAGFIFAFNPSHFAHSLHHVTITSIQFVPFLVWSFYRLVKNPFRWRWLFATSAFLALGALCDWNYFLFGVLFMALASVYLAFRNGFWKWTRAAGLRVVSALGLGALIVSPLLIPMVIEGLSQKFLRDLPGYDIYVADFMGFWVPSGMQRLGQLPLFQGLNYTMSGNPWEKAVYLGWGGLLLILLSAKEILKTKKRYVLALVFFMVLSMGTAFHFLGKTVTTFMPYRLIEITPLLKQARNPSRMIVYAYLFLAILAGFSVKHLFSGQFGKSRLGKTVWAVFVVVIILEFYPAGVTATPVTLPQAYEAVMQDPEKDFAILEIPWDGGRYMFYQTLHGIPTVQGYLGRRFEASLLNRLTFDPRRLEEQQRLLKENKVKYVLLFKKKMDWNETRAEDRRYALILSSLAREYAKRYSTIYEDNDAAVFRAY